MAEKNKNKNPLLGSGIRFAVALIVVLGIYMTKQSSGIELPKVKIETPDASQFPRLPKVDNNRPYSNGNRTNQRNTSDQSYEYYREKNNEYYPEREYSREIEQEYYSNDNNEYDNSRYEQTYSDDPIDNRRTRSQRNASVSILSWNLQYLGREKNIEELEYIASVMKNYDIVAVQEVVTSSYGARAVGELVDLLDRTGSNWDYALSPATDGPAPERYAYFWKKDKVELMRNAWLARVSDFIHREPYMARFALKGNTDKQFLLANFHAQSASNFPEKEVTLLDNLHAEYEKDNMIFLGDFNLSDNHLAFDDLKREGYLPVVRNVKTTLKRSPDLLGNYLYSPFDNMFYEVRAFERASAGIEDFTVDFDNFDAARKISDHVPVFGVFIVK